MFPGVFGFHWEPGHLIFLTIFFGVVAVIGGTWALGLWRSVRGLRESRNSSLLWKLTFQNLPAEDKRCRHELTGELASRVCPNAFDCGHCPVHSRLDGQQQAGPATMFYDRGHTWLMPQADGTVTIGLDPIAARIIGVPDEVRLPAVGTHLRKRTPAWRMSKSGVQTRVLAPIDGAVVEVGDQDRGWYLRVRPDRPLNESRHLLKGREAEVWASREMDRLQGALGCPALGPVLADGGTLSDDIPVGAKSSDLDRVCSGFFLQP